MSSKKSQGETKGYALSDRERIIADQERAAGANVRSQGDVIRQEGEAARAKYDPTLSQYEGGSALETPFGKALLSTRQEATNRAFQGAQVAGRQRAQMAGYGYQTNPALARTEEAEQEHESRLSQLPAEVTAQAAPLQLQAAGMREAEAQQRGQEALGYGNQALGYYGAAQGAENLGQRYFQDASEVEQARRRARGGFWGSLAKVGARGVGYLAGGPAGLEAAGKIVG